MKPSEWKTIGLFAAAVFLVGLVDSTAGLWLGGAALFIIVVKHTEVFRGWFG